jgi:hypothetical protein
MFEIGILALIVLCVVAVRQHKRLNRIERELVALRELAGAPVAKAIEASPDIDSAAVAVSAQAVGRPARTH